MEQPTKFDAIHALVGGAITGSEDGAEIKYLEGQTPPSKEDVDAKFKELTDDFNALAYSRKREAEYPSIQECVHAILDDDLDALQKKRAEIKKKYPKG